MDTWIPRWPNKPLSAQAESSSLDINMLLCAVRRRLPLFGGIVAAVVALTVFYVMQMTPLYTASTSIVLDQRKHDIVTGEQVLSSLPSESSVVDTEVEVIASEAMAERVARKLSLDDYPEFNPALRKPGKKPLSEREKWDTVIHAVSRRLKVERTGATYLIDVSFTSRDPEVAAMVANAFGSEYLASQLEAKFDATQHANDWLRTQLDQLQVEMRDADAAVQIYKIEHNLLGASGATSGATLNEQEAANLERALSEARADLSESEARYSAAQASLRRGSMGEDIAETLSSPTIQNLRLEIAKASQNVANLRGRLGPNHPTLQDASHQLEALQTLLASEVRRIVSGLGSQVDAQRHRVQALQENLLESRGELADNNQATVELKGLEQKASAARAMYSSYLDRFLETASQVGIQQADARIVSPATPPRTPSAPKKGMTVALGLLVAVLIAGVALFVAEAFDTSLSTAEEVERAFDLPLLGSIAALPSTMAKRRRAKALPVTASGHLLAAAARGVRAAGAILTWIFFHPAPRRKRIEPFDYVVNRPFSSFSEAFRSLRAGLKIAKSKGNGKVVAITSSLPGEGKTTSSLCLARILGLAGTSVIVVDCDLRRKGVSQAFANDPSVGLVEVLEGTASLGKAITSDVVMGVFVLPLAKTTVTPRDIFSSEPMGKLLAELRSTFDVIILDCPPVLAVADTGVIAPQADMVLVLAQWRKTPRKALERCLRMLTSVGSPLAGIVLTQVDQKQQAREGYGDAGYYFNEYKHYYQT